MSERIELTDIIVTVAVENTEVRPELRGPVELGHNRHIGAYWAVDMHPFNEALPEGAFAPRPREIDLDGYLTAIEFAVSLDSDIAAEIQRMVSEIEKAVCQ